jgi:hypothetical protein
MGSFDEQKIIGGKRKNGHKMDCGCHICKNMEAKAERNGYEEDLQKEQERKRGGPTKKNGHKMDCGCPICKNMKNAKSTNLTNSKKNTSAPTSKDNKSTDNKNTDKKSNGHKMDCGCPICKNMNKKGGGETGAHKPISMPNTNENTTNDKTTMTNKGGKRKSNGHKPGCGCPICKNMNKTRRHKKKNNMSRKRL